jgi:hypothetical protein
LCLFWSGIGAIELWWNKYSRRLRGRGWDAPHVICENVNAVNALL